MKMKMKMKQHVLVGVWWLVVGYYDSNIEVLLIVVKEVKKIKVSLIGNIINSSKPPPPGAAGGGGARRRQRR